MPNQGHDNQMSEQSETVPKPVRRHGRRFGMWVLTSVIMLATGAGIALLVLVGRPIEAPRWLRDMVLERVAVSAPDLHVDFGAMSLVLETGLLPRVILQDVTIGEAVGRPLITLSDLRATFALKPLIQGQLKPKGVWLSGAYFLLRRNADGGFNLAIGDVATPVQHAKNLAELVENLDQMLIEPLLTSLSVVEADALTLRYEDLRAGRAWTVDGGRISLGRRGDNVQLRGDFTLLGGRDFASTLELTYDSKIGSQAASFGAAFQDMPAGDIARQAPALAWLEALRAPISGALRGGINARGELTPLSATLQIGAGVLQPRPETRPVPFSSARSYFTYAPQTGKFNFSELSVESKWVSARAEGQAQLQGLDQGWPSGSLGQFTLSEIRANPLDLYPQPVQLEAATIDLKLLFDPFHVKLGELTLHDQGQVLIARGDLNARPEGWDVSVSGKLAEMAPDRLMQLWPESLASITRAWVAKNVLTGEMSNIQVGLRAEPAHAPDIFLGFDFDAVDLIFMKSMPPVKGASGRASLMGNRFVVVADTGRVQADQGGAVDIAGLAFEVPNTKIKPAPAKVHLKSTSTITAALSLLDREPLRYMQKARQPITIADGRAEVSGLIDLVLMKKLPVDKIKFDIAGDLTAVRSDKVVPGRVLSAAALRVSVSNAQLVINGPGRIGQVPFEGEFRTALGGGSNKSAVRGWVELSERFTDEFRISLPPGSITGKTRAVVAIDLERNKKPSFTMSSRLEGVALRLAPLGWSMSQGATGSLSVSGQLDSPPRIDNLSLDAPGLKAQGSISLAANGQLERARFGRVQAGTWMDAPVELIGRGAGVVPAVRVTGGTIDMRKTDVGAGGDSAGSSGGGPISLALDKLIVSEGISLTNFKGEFKNTRGMEGTFSGRVNGDAPITGQVVPQKGRSAFRILSKNAGEVLRATGLLKQARGGELSLTLLPSGQAGSYNGTLKVLNTRLQDAPAMAALLSAMSVIGLLEQLGGSGIHFAEVDGSFRLTPNQVIVTKSSAIGASLGISMDGVYTLGTGAMDMQGVVSPVFMLNGIGSFLTRKGEGLLGFNYKLRGTASDPRVQVNPLSIFTPGMFREIFRRRPPKVKP